MALPIKHVLGILADNLRQRGSVMPLSRRRLTGWSRGLDLPKGGERILFTGHMYQMIPSLTALEAGMGLAEKTGLTKLMGIGRWVNNFINLSFFMTWPSNQEQQLFDQRLRKIAERLQQAGIDFGYLYEKELYTGALVYDLGAERGFEKHVRKIWKIFQKYGVKSVITVDPHTTEMLKNVFPRYLPDYKLEVKSYLEVLLEKEIACPEVLEQEVVLHDSCIYARALGLTDQPRQLLAKANIAVRYLENSGKATFCCGGPLESLFPQKAKELARERVSQLARSGCSVVAAMCPICLHNIQKEAKAQGITVKDIIEII